MPEGHQSPPPERQTGAQLQEPPASGHATDKSHNKTDKKEELKSQLENLESNPPDKGSHLEKQQHLV